jgi:hypothetical protein
VAFSGFSLAFTAEDYFFFLESIARFSLYCTVPLVYPVNFCEFELLQQKLASSEERGVDPKLICSCSPTFLYGEHVIQGADAQYVSPKTFSRRDFELLVVCYETDRQIPKIKSRLRTNPWYIS